MLALSQMGRIVFILNTLLIMLMWWVLLVLLCEGSKLTPFASVALVTLW